MYYPIWNLTRHVFCLSVILGFVQKLFDIVLSISLFSSHLWNWCVWLAMTSKFFFIIFEDVFFKVSYKAFVRSFLH